MWPLYYDIRYYLGRVKLGIWSIQHWRELFRSTAVSNLKFIQKKPVCLRMYVTCSEVPSNMSTMVVPLCKIWNYAFEKSNLGDIMPTIAARISTVPKEVPKFLLQFCGPLKKTQWRTRGSETVPNLFIYRVSRGPRISGSRGLKGSSYWGLRGCHRVSQSISIPWAYLRGVVPYITSNFGKVKIYGTPSTST